MIRFVATATLCVISCVLFGQSVAHKWYKKSLLTGGHQPEAYQLMLKAAQNAPPSSELHFRSTTALAGMILRHTGKERLDSRPLYQHIQKLLGALDFTQALDSVQADFCFTSGKLYDIQYKTDSAILLIETARVNFRRLAGAGTIAEASCYQALGDVYKYGRYDFAAAEANYNKALSIFETIPNVDDRSLARLFYSLLTTNRSQQDYEKAVAYAMKTIKLVWMLKDPNFLERTYTSVANVYRDMGKYDSSAKYYALGISVNRSINGATENETLAGHYVGLGDSFIRQERWEEAITNLSLAARIYERHADMDRMMYLHACQLLAEVSLQAGSTEQGKHWLKKGQSAGRQLQLKNGGPLSSLYKTWGDYYKRMKNQDSAFYYYQQSLMTASSNFVSLDRNDNPGIANITLKEFAYDALIAKADLLSRESANHQSQTGFEQALACYHLSEQLLQQSRHDLDTEDAKWNFTNAHFQLYESALSVLDRMPIGSNDSKNVEEAFHFMEGSKSKMLADALQEVEMTNAHDSLLQFHRRLRQRSITLQHQWTDKKDIQTQEHLLETDKEISVVETQIETKYPGFLKAKYEAIDPGLNTLIRYAKNNSTSFVEYFWGSNHVYGLMITPEETRFQNLGSADSIQIMIENLVQFYAETANNYDAATVTSYRSLSYDIYHQLIGPFMRELDNYSKLVIIPDGLIAQIPFEAMIRSHDPEENSFARFHYLLNDFIISYAFSGSYVLRKSSKPQSSPNLLAFGYTGGSSIRSPVNSLADIAGVEKELLALAQKFPDGEFLSGENVTEANFKQKAGLFDILHLAVHGKGDTEQNYSATLFFREKSDSEEDGRLHWYELFGMRLQASLAVLSSCESGIGKSYRGEGMMSMASAFTFAGCRNLVMGLWKVDDRVSVELMNEFYGELLSGKSVDEALTMAKRKYLKEADPLTANPKSWGSLVAYGNQSIVYRNRSRMILMAVISLMIIVGIFIWRRKRLHKKTTSV